MKIHSILIVSLVLLLLIAACSARGAAPSATEAPAGFDQAGGGYSAPQQFESAATAIMEEMAAPTQAAVQAPSSGDQAAPPVSPSQFGRMIIKDALLDILVTDTAIALERATQLAADQGGYIISSRSWIENGYKYGELRMGVPSANFESTLNVLRKMGIKILNEQVSGQDVSAEYSDLKSQLTNLEATAARVREFLDQATTVEESLSINATLSDLEGQIEQVKGQMEFYKNRAAFSTIALTFYPDIPTPTPTPTATPTPTPTPAVWNPGATTLHAADAMVSLLQFLVDAFIWILFVGWPFFLIGFLIWWLIHRRKSRKSKAKEQEEKTEE